MLCMEHRYWQMEQLDDSLKVKLDVPPCNEFLYIPIDIDDSIVDESVAMDAFTDDSFWLLPALLAPPSVSSADNFVLDCGAVGMQHFVDKIEAMNGESFHRDTANASCYSLDENSIITNDVSYAARILEFTSGTAQTQLPTYNDLTRSAREQEAVRMAPTIAPRQQTGNPASVLGPLASFPAYASQWCKNSIQHSVQIGRDALSRLPSGSSVATPSSTDTSEWENQSASTMSPSGSNKRTNDDATLHTKPAAKKSKGNSRPIVWTPVRPLNAYNYFFRFERDRLLKFCADQKCTKLEPTTDLPAQYNIHYQLTTQNSAAFQTRLLYDQWSRDPDAKRPHSKVHGVISFHGLAKRIARSWSVLPRAVKDVFYAIAKKDAERYDNEIASMKP